MWWTGENPHCLDAWMPGKPKLHAFEALIEEAGRDQDMTGDEWVADLIAGGMSKTAVARDFGVSRRLFYEWENRTDERKATIAAAVKLRAEALAEGSGEVLDELADRIMLTPAEVALADKRSKYRQWMAAKLDPDTFGEQEKGANVNVNFGSLHLTALMEKGLAPAPSERLPAAAVEEEIG